MSIACISLVSCKKDSQSYMLESIKTVDKLPENISHDEFKVVKQYYSRIIGVDTSKISFNVNDKTFFIPNTQIKDSYEEIKLSYEIYTQYHQN